MVLPKAEATRRPLSTAASHWTEAIQKPAQDIPEDTDVSRIRIQNPSRYVSRGGYKLEAALKGFQIEVKDKTVLDLGASTGGFTDCLLQHGAAGYSP